MIVISLYSHFPFFSKVALTQFKVFSSYQTSVFNLLSLASFLSVEEKFHIEELTKAEAPSKISCFTMYLNRTWYRLEAKNKILSNDSTKGLDAAILQDHIFEPILKIDDPRISNRIDFIGGIRGLSELERRCELDAKVAFALYPVTIEQLLKVSDEGKVMPPKSTWFEPKLRSGLVVRSLH